MDGCVFCWIADGKSPAEIVQDWGDALAFRPLNPVTPGHLLVIPRRHVADVTESPSLSGQVMRRAAALSVQPCNIITSAGAEASQTVFHLHLHVVPRRRRDGLLLPWSNPPQPPARLRHAQ